MAITPQLSQAWTESWYPAMIWELMSLAGAGFHDDLTGTTMPSLSAIDTMAVLGLVTPSVVSAIERFNLQFNSMNADRAAVNSSLVDSEGSLSSAQLVVGGGLDSSNYISARTYITYTPNPLDSGLTSDSPWKRFPGVNPADIIGSLQSYEPYILKGDSVFQDGNAAFTIIRQCIADYQRMVQASASAIFANSANTAAPAPQDDLSAFLSALRSVCTDLDTLNENPPGDSRIPEALRAALGKAGEFAGKALADVANEVGKDAGIVGSNLLEGFLDNAAFLSVVVVAIVAHLYL